MEIEGDCRDIVGRLQRVLHGGLRARLPSQSPSSVLTFIDTLPHCPALMHAFGGSGVQLGSLALYAWAKERWGTAKKEFDLLLPDGAPGRYLVNFRAPMDDWASN